VSAAGSTAPTRPGGVEPHLFVIVGAKGDLTRRKLLPAVAKLIRRGAFDDRSAVLGASRGKEPAEADYRMWAIDALDGADADLRAWCDECLYYQPLGDAGQAGYARLAERIREIENGRNLSGNRIFYLALPPEAFPDAIECLGQAGLNEGPGWTRLVIEKPFGRDLASACELNRLVHQWFDEGQVYRIDHYLGKETVRNLLVFRFANPIFESLWNRAQVESVAITVAESLGVGHRAGYYDQAGALRDMVQNHMTQLFTLIGMEVPAAFTADAIRAEKVKVLRTMSPLTRDAVVFGQYAAGSVDGKDVPGYRDEERVPENSNTPTWVALRLTLPNWRWQGVPFYLRTGKRLEQRLTRIVVTFQRPPIAFFDTFAACHVRNNVLVITLQPDEGFAIGFEVKKPGDELELSSEQLRFRYADAFGALPEAYETLLADIATGDQTLFVHADEVEQSWRIYQPLLDGGAPVLPYRAGTWGPVAADRLIRATGTGWPAAEDGAGP
jgi:glucose-6-phosphate 1-dehydrogenase